MKTMKYTLTGLYFLSIFVVSTLAYGEEKNQEAATKKTPVTLCRIVWQDDADHTLKWSDLTRDLKGFSLNQQSLEGFPKLDSTQQNFVQMEESGGIIVLGIHDSEEGAFGSGWVAVDSGVVEEEHGDHSHWKFEKKPHVLHSQLDKEQGNPAHVYLYQGDIFLANDKKNGFTILSPVSLRNASTRASATRFFSGGGSHITLAAVDGKVCYATWVDREGDNAGRVDVVPIDHATNTIGYELKLPSGGLHGATANSGRVFFAPADGICWVDADVELSKKKDDVKIHHLSLGEDSETGKPRRTGAFSNHSHFVLVTTGAKESASFCMIDAKAKEPKIMEVSLPLEDGLAWTTPACVTTSAGKHFAFLFSDRRGSEATESLAIVNLDPNKDGDLSDAKLEKKLPVGASKVVGHGGHHEIGFSSSGRWAFVTNPGDGSIWVISLSTLEVESKHQVDGVPSRILVIGG
jgi:hypothetical protein